MNFREYFAKNIAFLLKALHFTEKLMQCAKLSLKNEHIGEVKSDRQKMMKRVTYGDWIADFFGIRDRDG